MTHKKKYHLFCGHIAVFLWGLKSQNEEDKKDIVQNNFVVEVNFVIIFAVFHLVFLTYSCGICVVFV